MVRRYAFTMIELIFAIVIIAITVLSLPMMTNVNSKGIENNLIQEAIFASAAKLNDVVTYRWDENSIDVDNTNAMSQIINSGGTDCNTSGQRPGAILQPLHRRCLNDTSVRATTLANLGSDTGETDSTLFDDIDDLQETDANLTSGLPGRDSYKDNYTSTITIGYASFGTVGVSEQNIKEINSSISDDTGVITKLRTYSANIGEIDYYKRSF
ncbi:type II secretion system protein [Sulfurimonas sp. SAG-AH-194-C20]|nr:type II secretion system protein [Sulfurimonas sp. SAG-AH-194-C20]MDF1879523.1 type II secretion system protein [Sulfurimonas sp. SAG-AH-194-C20]